MIRRSFAVLLAASLAACGGEAEEAESVVDDVIEVAGVGFQTPESVLHDPVADVYLISNINGAPTEKDDNGFISRMSPEGQVQELAWITGDSANVTLHAPKGMAIRGDTLYVADIDCVKLFVRTTAAPAGEICIQGATFLNGVAVDAAGTIYVTDSGLNPDFTPNGTDGVWRFTPGGETSRMARGEQLGGPNGIAFDDEGAYVVTFRTGEVYQIGPAGQRTVVVPGTSTEQLDGIAFTGDGGYLYSSWGHRAVHWVDDAGASTVLLENVESPADIGFDAQRRRVLVPLFTPNAVLIKDVPPNPPPNIF